MLTVNTCFLHVPISSVTSHPHGGMTSRFLWLFLFILLDTPIHLASSMNSNRILLTLLAKELDTYGSDQRRFVRDLGGQGHTNKQQKENDTDAKDIPALNINMTVISGDSSVDTDVVSEAPPGLNECNPCVILKVNSPKRVGDQETDDAYHPNLTIIPMGGVFMFIACLILKFIHWCNEDIRLADERYMKISVPTYLVMSDSPQASPSLPHHLHHQHPHRRVHRRSSVSVANIKLIQNATQNHATDDDTTANTIETSESEDTTVIYNADNKPRKPVVPAAAAGACGGGGASPIGKSMSQRLGLTRSPRPNRYLRRQSLNSSSNTTLSSSMSSSRSPSMRTRTISFQEEEEEEEEEEESRMQGVSRSLCGSSSMSPGQSSLDITPLLFRQHSTPSNETPFAQRKTLAFRTHLLSPPLLHFQVSSSSADTSMTSLGESMPSFASRPSVCDSTLTEQEIISEDGESLSGAAPRSPRPLSAGGGGLMLFTGSYSSEDPLIIQCSYLEVDETSEPAVFTLGSPTPSNTSNDAPLSPLPDDQDPGGEDVMEETDRAHNEPPLDTLEESDTSSDCNSESELTAHEGGYPRDGIPSSTSQDLCPHGPTRAAYRRALDPSLYYKLSMESNESTGSLQSPESMQSDSTSVCSSDVGLVRRAGPSQSSTSAAFRALGQNITGRTSSDGRPLRRERISLNGFGYLGQHGGRRIQNGKVMRMCRSWCLGDKASAIYGQVRRGLQEKECYM